MSKAAAHGPVRHCLISIVLLALPAPALAGEGGASFYLLGTGGPGAAELPPLTGVYFDNTIYYYPGTASASRQFVVGGNLVAGLDAKLPADFVTALWVPTTNFLGGTLALGLAGGIAQPDITVSAVITGPLGNQVSISRKDIATVVVDPIAIAEVGWSLGTDLHGAVSVSVNVPVGEYREGQLANASFHRWVVDTSGALTWADEKSGWDISGKVGFTFNGTNQYTNYKSGTDLHLEGSLEKKLSKSFSLGLQAYHLQQISGDSGAGATLGSFKGRVTGLGPTAAYSFMAGRTPVSLRVRYFEEFGVKNRLDGRAFFFSLDAPLHMNLPPQPPAASD